MDQPTEQRRVASYYARVAVGLIPFCAVAVTLRAYVAAEAIVAAVIVIATVASERLLRDPG